MVKSVKVTIELGPAASKLCWLLLHCTGGQQTPTVKSLAEAALLQQEANIMAQVDLLKGSLSREEFMNQVLPDTK
jgi:hypothetical protein